MRSHDKYIDDKIIASREPKYYDVPAARSLYPLPQSDHDPDQLHAALVLGQDQVYLPTAGSVTFIQLFGSSLAANPRLHMMFLDGVFARAKGGIKFFERGGFTHESMFDVLEMIYLRLTKLFSKKGYVLASGGANPPEEDDGEGSMPFRPRAPKAFRRKGLGLSQIIAQPTPSRT